MTTRPTFKPTHRMIVNASAKRGYNILTIDLNSGYFKKDDVPQNETLIRVNKDVLGESLSYSGNTPLTNKELLEIGKTFNTKRKELGFNPVDFDRIESAYAKSL